MLGKDDDAAQRIWKIRNLIHAFEKVKDTIIEFLNFQETIDTSTRRIWIADVKEAYYSVVSGWQMLDAASKREKKYAESSQQFLGAAKHRVDQCISELRSIGGTHALELESALLRTFTACYTEMLMELAPYMDKHQPNPPESRVLKISENEYHLPCMVCGEIAVVLTFGKSQGESEVIYRGITHQTSLDRSMNKALVRCLNDQNIAGIHDLVKEKKSMEDGVDAYCPVCDKIYCKRHYQVTVEWDEGYYDCSYGTCPKGHRRIIDD